MLGCSNRIKTANLQAFDIFSQVCNGEILTVRIPTADDGRYIYWEFATDDYDLAFGVSFEWNKCPDPEVTLDVNDSESEDDDDFWDDDEYLTDVVNLSGQKCPFRFGQTN